MEIFFLALVAYGLYNFLFSGNKKEKSNNVQQNENSSGAKVSIPSDTTTTNSNELDNQLTVGKKVTETLPVTPVIHAEQPTVRVPVETIQSVTKEDVPKPSRQVVSTGVQKKSLPKGEIRKLFEEKYADKYFPALRIVTDNRDLKFCPQDGEPLFNARAVCKTERIEKARCCPLCSTAFIIKEEFIEDFSGGSNTLWVCRCVQSCSQRKHHVVSATGILTRMDLSTVRINVQYCYDCREYFISRQQYDKYKIIYKDLMGNIQFVDNLTNRTPLIASNFSQESLLHINGYNVSSNSKLTESDRRRILGYVIDNDILTKAEVIHHLSMLIDNARLRRTANMANAIKKWESDMHWINYYRIDGQFKVHFDVILKKPPKRCNRFP